jgi:cation transporter-like permease
MTAGTIVGGFVPELWGASGFSVAALLTSALGGAAGLWVGARLSV